MKHLALLFLVLQPSMASAEEFIVPDMYPTIGDAMSAAYQDDENYHDDVILVMPGVHPVELKYAYSAAGTLVIRSTQGPDVTFMDCENRPLLYQGTNEQQIIDGFTILNGRSGNTSAVLHSRWQFRMENCIIRKEDNPASTSAVEVEAYGFSMRGCTISGSWSAARLDSSTSMVAEECWFIGSSISAPCTSVSTYLNLTDCYLCEVDLNSGCQTHDLMGNVFINSCDCDANAVDDILEINDRLLPDCNRDFIPDLCQVADGSVEDCNENIVPDDCETESGDVPDLNQDGIPDSCQCICDLNGDELVDAGDLGILLGFWGNPKLFPDADINNSGNVDSADLGLMLGFWGPCS